ncbi:response regulator transcription factor [Solwaraspora sp. WMMB335]|uniref:response regulator transcription factor n=1 Tax=Solwaraspora sp. WMMB335 TaxID=3404118 RepID=UPI003B92EA44
MIIGVAPDPGVLSNREVEVMRHLAAGLTYAATARQMRISPHTVDAYLRRIKKKVGTRSRTDLLLLAVSLSGGSVSSPTAV